jgi:hypothetical protein
METAAASEVFGARERPDGIAIAPALAVAAFASLSAGAIHAAAAGVHSENRATVVAFSVTALAQLVWAVVAFWRSGRAIAWVGAAINLAAVGGWVLAKTYGIGFVKGLDVSEGPGFADTLCAALAAIAVIGAILAATVWPRPARWFNSFAFGALALVTAVITLVGMINTSSHTHSHNEADGHSHAAGTTGTSPDGHTHAPAVVPPKEYDPTKPIDLGGVAGVTPQEQARAENLIGATLLSLPKYADYHTAEKDGYVSIGDGLTGTEHFIKPSYFDDDHVLDPDFAESLVYDVKPDGTKKLAAAMYMLGSKKTFKDVPDVGGKLTQWHIHNNLCFTSTGQVAGLTDGSGNCRPGLSKGSQNPMLHVWIEKNPCGPFAALEGVGGGQIPAGQTKLCDTAHGSTGATG